MAIMAMGCCCFSDTRSGTIASAVHTLLYTFVLLFLTGLAFTVLNWPWTPSSVLAIFYIQFVAYALVFVTSILAMVGTAKDAAGLLLPYLVCLPLMMAAEGACYVTLGVRTGFVHTDASLVILLSFVIFVGFLGLNMCCLLCAISQYQELRAGRGRAADVADANMTTNVLMMLEQPVTTHHPPGVI